jgi:hypothetical protein
MNLHVCRHLPSLPTYKYGGSTCPANFRPYYWILVKNINLGEIAKICGLYSKSFIRCNGKVCYSPPRVHLIPEKTILRKCGSMSLLYSIRGTESSKVLCRGYTEVICAIIRVCVCADSCNPWHCVCVFVCVRARARGVYYGERSEDCCQMEWKGIWNM